MSFRLPFAFPALALALAGCPDVNSPSRLIYSTESSNRNDIAGSASSTIEVYITPSTPRSRIFSYFQYERSQEPWFPPGLKVEFLLDTEADLRAGRQDMRDADLMVRVLFLSEEESSGSRLFPVAELLRRSEGAWTESADLWVQEIGNSQDGRGVRVEVPETLLAPGHWFTWMVERIDGEDTLRTPSKPHLQIVDEDAFRENAY